MKHTSSNRGFTLIELLVVIAIIGLLSSVVLASLSTARAKSRDARRIADMSQIKIALELYNDEKGYYPGSYQGWNGRCPGAPTTPCFDLNSYNVSNNTGWPYLATELAPYLSKLPSDPLNVGSAIDNGNDGKCTPWQVGCFVYAYGNVGKNYGRITYDLAARLETANHPQSAAKQGWRYGYGLYSTTTSSFQYPDGNAWSDGSAGRDAVYDPSTN
jgi:prepilin-type N-terminal cleavage/methylation domain-containing protein